MTEVNTLACARVLSFTDWSDNHRRFTIAPPLDYLEIALEMVGESCDFVGQNDNVKGLFLEESRLEVFRRSWAINGQVCFELVPRVHIEDWENLASFTESIERQ